MLAMGVAGLLLWCGQWLCHSRYLARWDSAQYALALEQFDVRLHQPHPPGYPAYVVSGWLGTKIMGGEPNRGYLLVNWLLLGGAAWATWLLGRAWGGVLAGGVAALLLLASPLTLYYGSVALSYPAGACWFAWLGWSAWRVRQEGDPRWWWPFVIAAIGGAYRLPSLVLGLPLLAWVWWGLPGRQKHLSLVVLTGLSLAAYVPVWQASGGVGEWLQAIQTEGVKHETRFGRFESGPLQELAANWRAMRDFFWLGFALPIPVVVVLALIPVARRLPSVSNADDSRIPLGFLCWWVLPGVLFYLIVHVNFTGIFLDYAPSVALVIGCGSTRVTQRQPLIAALFLALMLPILLWRFATGDPRTDLSWPLLRMVDQAMVVHVDDIPKAGPSSQTLVLLSDSFKQAGYYLPNHRVIWDKYLLLASSPPDHPILTMQRHRLEPWVLPGTRLADGRTVRFLAFPAETHWLIVTNGALQALDPAQQSQAEMISERSEGLLQRLDVSGYVGAVLVTGGGWQLVQQPPAFAAE
ncbi:MAG: hypothetical protein GEEBNDBF_00984 [bacterium]|nr:hypothetical protein [bacterium]